MSIQYTANQMQSKFPGPPGAPGFPRLADVLRVEGRIEEAIQVCQDGLRVRPDTLSAYLVLGKAFLDSGRAEEARDQFEAALRLDPRCLSAMHFLARIMTKLQWAEAAAGYYRSILEVEPWDAEIRALLEETDLASRGSGSPPGGIGAGIGFTSPSPAAEDFASEGFTAADPLPGEDTFHKPDGLAGDVLEVNLNDETHLSDRNDLDKMAAGFLPARDPDASTSMGLVEESLEDALSDLNLAPEAAPAHEEKRKAPAVPENIPEPKPLDVFRDETPVQPDVESIQDAPPISGQDVEDRLDSLFGSDDGPTASMPSPTSTWTAAPAGISEPDIAAPDAGPEATATATGEMRAAETGEMPAGPAGSGDDFPSARTTIQSGTGAQSGVFNPFDLGAIPDAPVPDAISIGDYGAVDFVTPVPETPPAAESGNETLADAERVEGEDIERRLDELFSLNGEDGAFPAQAPAPAVSAAAAFPVAPGPRVEEAVSLGEAVSFGGQVEFREADAPTASDRESVTGQDNSDQLDNLFGTEQATKTEFMEVPPQPAQASGSDAVMEEIIPEAAAFRETLPQAMPSQVAGDPEAKPGSKVSEPPPPDDGDVMSTESMLPPGWFGAPVVSNGTDAPSGERDAAYGEIGDGPAITGADVEDQLDRLFGLDEHGEASKPGARPDRGDTGNPGDTAAFKSPEALDLDPAFGSSKQAGAPTYDYESGDQADMTVIMPAMHDSAPLQDERLPHDAGRIKESVTEWLAIQNAEADQRAKANDASGPDDATGALRASDISPAQGASETKEAFAAYGSAGEYDAAITDEMYAADETSAMDAGRATANPYFGLEAGETMILPHDAGAGAEDGDPFDTLAPEDTIAFSETAAIEMVDGVDVAERLDELFAEPDLGEAGPGVSESDAPAHPGSPVETEMSLFNREGAGAFAAPGLENVVTGEDVSARLDALFETSAVLKDDLMEDAPTETGVPIFMETNGEAPSMAGLEKTSPQSSPDLAPMLDEEEGYPEEEEPGSGTATGANVATVTLAEIYFQQGLREQALQIYRQLLEREPENEAVRKRIEEIEAAKPEGGERGPGSDPRRPRPGLKVPKRKK